jgi:trigger factor
MKHTLKQISPTRTLATVSVDADTIAKAKELAVKELGKKVKVPGFRAGKVPTNVVEKNLDPTSLANETVEYAINRAMNEIIEETDLRVLDQPKVELKKFVPFDTLEFTAEFDVLPAVTLGDYKKLKAKKEAIVVDPAEITEVVERMQKGFAVRSDVERTVKDGDEATINFVGKDEKGEAIEGASGEEYPLIVGSNAFIPGFEEQLIGHAKDETFDISVTFPKDYHADHLKGAKVVFTVTITKLQEVTLPKVDDEFAKKVGPFDTAKALKEDIKKELTAQKERAAVEKLKDDLLGQLVTSSEVPVPEVLIEDQIRHIEQDAMQNLMYRGQTLEQYMAANDYADHEEWHTKELRPMAEKRVQAGLIIAELSKAEKIDVSKEELDAELERRKGEAPAMADQLDTPDARRDLANRVITEKTIERLVELNTK